MAEEKNPAAVALGRLGGAKGARACAANMTKEERVKAARKAANARWAKKRQLETPARRVLVEMRPPLSRR